MSLELRLLLWSCLLGFANIVASGMANTATLGLAYGFSARDAQKQPGGMAGRLQRAFRNFMESFPFFAAACLVATVSNQHTRTIALGAELYFWARVIYLPLYILGVPVIRSVVWGASIIGVLMMILPLL